MIQVLKTSAFRESIRRSSDMKRMRKTSQTRATLARVRSVRRASAAFVNANLGAPSIARSYVQGDTYEVGENEADDTNVLVPPLTIPPNGALTSRRGLGPLPWIETDAFRLLVCMGIATNLLVLTATYFKALDLALPPPVAAGISKYLLGAYVCELVLRLLHFGPSRFFVDRQADAVVNVVDLTAVLLAVLDPFDGPAAGAEAPAPQPVLALRALRLLSGLPRARLAQCFCGDLAWTESASWQWFVGAVICFNAIIMGAETEMPGRHWDIVENIMLLFFVFEIGMRVRRLGIMQFAWGEDQFWNGLDTVIVVTGVCDLWLVPLCMGSKSALIASEESASVETEETKASGPSFAKMMMLMRMLRLMRILRLLRLVKAVRPLYQLATGILSAMQGMFWVLVLTLVALYAFALIATSFFGEHALVKSSQEYTARQHALFGNVLDSMFTLFGLMNGQYWSEVSPILDKLPWLKPMYVFFTILSNWALLSVMTSVVSDNMLKVRQEQENKDIDSIEEMRAHLNSAMADLIAHADPERTGTLEKRVYQDLLYSMSRSKSIQQYQGLQGFSQNLDLNKMLDWLDVDGTGRLETQDFMQGFDWLNSVVSGKSLLKLEVSMRRRCMRLEKAIKKLQAEVDHAGRERTRQTSATLEELNRARDHFAEEAEKKWKAVNEIAATSRA